MFRESIDSHASRNDLANWAMSYKVLGQSVCKDAFMTITGISAWALTDARNAAQKGHQSSLGAAELGTGALLKNTNKEPVYLGCRAWLENYAATHAEMSPHSCEAVLPWGRKEFFYAQYEQERISKRLDVASLSTFLKAWRTELPWLLVAKSTSKFVLCGLCEYLREQINLTPRDQTDIIRMLRARLGQHYEFQSAQRCAQARIQEKCHSSNGKIWHMKIDKMDQNACNLPTVWNQLATPLFKQGHRVLLAVNGSHWAGPTKTRWHIRTLCENVKHGSNMQMSTLVLNLYDALEHDALPEELLIGSDNTPKETKNSIGYHWMMWLLAISTVNSLDLWSVLLTNLIVGHTHDEVDRFFSRVRAALAGHDYY